MQHFIYHCHCHPVSQCDRSSKSHHDCRVQTVQTLQTFYGQVLNRLIVQRKGSHLAAVSFMFLKWAYDEYIALGPEDNTGLLWTFHIIT